MRCKYPKKFKSLMFYLQYHKIFRAEVIQAGGLPHQSELKYVKIATHHYFKMRIYNNFTSKSNIYTYDFTVGKSNPFFFSGVVDVDFGSRPYFEVLYLLKKFKHVQVIQHLLNREFKFL